MMTMKKVIFFLCMLATLSVHSQETVTKVVDKVGSYRDYLTRLEGKGSDHYLFFSGIVINAANPSYNKWIVRDVIVLAQKDGTTGKRINIEHTAEYELLTAYEGPEDLILVYCKFKDSEKNFVLYLNRVPKDTGQSGVWNPEKIISIPMERKDDMLIHVARSKDDSKAAVLMMHTRNNSFLIERNDYTFKGAAAVAFGEEGLIWSQPIPVGTANNTLQLFDFAIGNDATAFAVIKSFNKKGDVHSNETMHSFRLNSDDVMATTDDFSTFEFGSPSNGKILVTEDGRPVIGGYYASEPGGKEVGTYTICFENESFYNPRVSFAKFPQEYFSYKHPKSADPAKEYTVWPMDFYEFSDGTLALLGEPHNETSIMSSTYTLAGNIIVNFVNKQGDLSDASMIQKSQAIMLASKSLNLLRISMFSFNTYMKDDLIHVFFIDDIANYMGKRGEACVVGSYSSGKHCMAYCTIDPRQNISSPIMLIDYKKQKTRVYVPLFVDHDGVWIYNSEKMFAIVSKFLHTF